MARVRCSKCGKFMINTLVGGYDPASPEVFTVRDFSIHLCYNRRGSDGKFSKTAPRTLLQPFDFYKYATQSKM